MKKTIFDLTRKEGVKIDKELRKTSYFKQYGFGYLYSSVMMVIFGLIYPLICDLFDVSALSPDIKAIVWVVIIGFFSLFSLLFWFKRFDLVKQYYEEKCNKGEK